MQPEIITNIVVGVLLALFTAILAWQGKGRFDARFDELARDVADLKQDNTLIRSELVSIHATIAQIALAVNSRPRPEAG